MGTTNYSDRVGQAVAGQQPHEGGSALAEQIEAVTGLNADSLDESAPLDVRVTDPVRTRPMRPRRWVADSLNTDALLAAPVRILTANPHRRRVIIATGGGGIVKIGPTEQTCKFQMPNNSQVEFTADGDVWALAGAAAFNLFWLAEYDD